jgi:phosphoribosylaminoimidazole (AIR) synthetase
MIAVVDAAAVERVSAALSREGERVRPIGRIVHRAVEAAGTQLINLEGWQAR